MVRPLATTRTAAGLPTGRLAVWWVIASEIVIFGGLLASYIMHRLGHESFAEQAASTNIIAGAVNTFILLTSSLSAVLAHAAAEKGDGPKAAKYLGYTFLGGLGFLAVKTWEWGGKFSHGISILSGGFWGYYFTAAGIHAVHVIAGMVIMLFVAADARKNKELQRVELIGLYWHFVDIVWIFLFPLLYIAK